ncbi:low-density lipoprotein receptor-related protein 1B-like [Stylophora pistillata]|uniref:low-density lipoprotein receptor-related protein 1B-like n=1 Tax=Stylophora pistillata TaxID=50429 RepID=UPI000C04E20C|nr:low-density lipoprotein receptor-related protein 1B-like [Stylophora pistillata]
MNCNIFSCDMPYSRHGCNGNVTEYPYSTECQFSCSEGYKLIGSGLRKCQDNGLWSRGGEFYREIVTCPVLSLPTYGVFLGCNTNATEMLYGTECWFSYKEGSVAMGSIVRRCTANGTWTGTDLECTVSRRLFNSPRLLVSTRRSIIVVNFENNSSLTVISNLRSTWGLDFHYNLDYIFWSDLSERNIKRSNMDGTNIAVIQNYVYSYGLAVQWNSLQLYLADFNNHSISVSDLEGNNRTTVLSTFQPFEIVLDPHQGMNQGLFDS